MTKVIYSCPLDPVRNAAPGYHVRSVVSEFNAKGFDVELVHKGPHLKGLDLVRQHALNVDKTKYFGRIGGDLLYSIGLYRLIRRIRTAFVAYHRLEKWSVLPCFLFLRKNCQFILEINADIQSELKSIGRSRAFCFFVGISERIQVKLADEVIVVSEGIKVGLSARYPQFKEKITVIENGTDVDLYFPRSRNEACEELGLDKEYQYVIFAGSLQKWQGLELLVEAAAAIRINHPSFRTLIVGDGACAGELREMIDALELGDVVELVGWQSGERLALYLAASDICVAPYSSLGGLDQNIAHSVGARPLLKCSPLKIFTYMAMGKPVISSDFRDAGARLVEWNAGVAFAIDSSGDLAEKITNLLGNTEQMDLLGRNGYKKIQSDHTWSHVVDRIVDLCSIR